MILLKGKADRNAYMVFLLAVCSFCVLGTAAGWPEPPPDAPGVAFSLTPNYGTAAIYFANGSIAKVAYIQGNAMYRAFMGREQPPIQKSPSWCDALPDLVERLMHAICSRNLDVDAAKDLLKALKQSVTSYLGTTFCFADMVLPNPNHQSYQQQTLETAIRNIGLQQPRRVINAASAAVAANMPYDAPDTSDKVVLAIDYSGYGLNAALMSHDGGTSILRQQYNPSLGAENASSPQHWDQVKSVIMEIAKPPYGKSVEGWPLPKRIQNLVLYGDKAKDAALEVALKEVLGADLVEKALAFDPLFASAVAMAHDSFRYMRWPEFQGHPTFWCRWRSKLYTGGHTDL